MEKTVFFYIFIRSLFVSGGVGSLNPAQLHPAAIGLQKS